MKVLIVEPKKAPFVREIEDNLKSYQEIVGGYIQAIYPFDDPEVCLVCNDEGKLQNLPMNRALKDETGHIYDVVSGTFFLCAALAGEDHFSGLTEEQIKKYSDYYARPEGFIVIDGQLYIIKR